ncbi:MAG: Ldh family oxidoreductase [Gammaproteobacteria bacterium]|nr:Ldh family oxidoreductase [Gammaproteobacteria bacterium]
MPTTQLSADSLSEFCINAYLALGLSRDDSELVADSLVQADLWGHQSHGVMRTFWYGKRIQSGATRVAAVPELVIDGGAVAVMDGKDGVGQVVVRRAMQEAIDRSKLHGIGAVAVRNSGHFGTAMYFSRMAVCQGCIGFLCTNASPAMAPWGGRSKLIGTNPWSIAAPAGRYAPMMLDIANTAVARGKLYVAGKKGEAIPEGWAIDSDGRPTTDAAAGILGNILPMAGHKGFAVATMMDVLSGILSGSQFGDAVVGPYVAEGRSGVGHLVIALDIGSFRPLEDFNADAERLVDSIRNNPLADGSDRIYYPGEPEAQAEQVHRKTGVEIPADTLAELDEAASAMGILPLSVLAQTHGGTGRSS